MRSTAIDADPWTYAGDTWFMSQRTYPQSRTTAASSGAAVFSG